MKPIYRITVHHSADFFVGRSKTSAADEIRRIQQAHQKDWADIGYHYMIDRQGRVWEGRSIAVQGAHAGSNTLNRGNVGVCLLGNFNIQLVTQDQERALRILLANLMDQFDVSPTEIHTHKELKNTVCPGQRLQSLVNRIREELRQDSSLKFSQLALPR